MIPIRKLRSLFRKDKLDTEMAEEMRAHVELQTERNVVAGMNPDEARYAALRQFGNVASLQEQARDRRGWVWLEQLGQDLRYAVRMLAKAPGFTVTAVLTLALGIGVNAALFTVYDIIALRPLPSRDPDQLVDIRGYNAQGPGRINPNFSYPDYLEYCAGTGAFTDIVVSRLIPMCLPEEVPPETTAPEDAPRDIRVFHAVSGNFLSVLGAEIALGRDFLPAEAGLQAGRPVVVLSHRFWQTHLHGDPKVLGRILMTQDPRGPARTAYTVIGVAAPNFVGQSPNSPAGWIPLTATADPVLGDRTKHILWMTGRLRAGISPDQARADLEVVTQRLAREFPEERRANTVQLQPAMRILNLDLDLQRAVGMSPLLLGFALVLVIACLNVANLLLARGVTRQHEIGVRLVLGAGRGRLVRQLFAENFLLCVLGAAAALVLAMWALQALRPALLSVLSLDPETLAFVSTVEIGLDRRIIGFGALLAVVAGLTAGLTPALHSVRRDGVFALKHEGSAFGRKMTPSRLRGLLLVGQVAVCLTLLAVCGMLTGKLLRTRAAGTGFSMDGVYLATPSAASGAANALASDPLGAIETLRTLPGVVSACMAGEVPLRKPGDNNTPRSVPLRIGEDTSKRISYNRVSAGFFESLGVPVVRGRAFTPRETSGGALVVVVSESAARRLWPAQEALGKILEVDDGLFVQRTGPEPTAPSQGYRECEVIGVSRDFLTNWDGNQGKDIMFLPLPAKGAAASILVRVQSETAESLRGMEQTSLAAGLPVKFQERLAVIVDRSLWPYRMMAWISGALTGLALLLAIVGLYGVMSFGVNQRVREIGIRMALGATAGRVTGFFVRQGMRLVAYGVALGLVGATAFGILLANVWAVPDFAGPVAFRCAVFAAVTLLLMLVALIACWLPARRAAKIDPMVALRAE